jgi:hypothetical protein
MPGLLMKVMCYNSGVFRLDDNEVASGQVVETALSIQLRLYPFN